MYYGNGSYYGNRQAAGTSAPTKKSTRKGSKKKSTKKSGKRGTAPKKKSVPKKGK